MEGEGEEGEGGERVEGEEGRAEESEEGGPARGGVEFLWRRGLERCLGKGGRGDVLGRLYRSCLEGRLVMP